LTFRLTVIESHPTRIWGQNNEIDMSLKKFFFNSNLFNNI